jgi:hypothetical protein
VPSADSGSSGGTRLRRSSIQLRLLGWQWASSTASVSALEGTVLRVPCIPSARRCGFWRSSVRSRGPPALGCNRFSDRRRRAWCDCLADDSTAPSVSRQPDPFVLRVARPSARTRCGRSVANCSAGVCGKPSPPIGNAGEAPALIPVLAADLGDIALNDTSSRRDVYTKSWDEVRHLQTSQSSSTCQPGWRLSGSLAQANRRERDVSTAF